MKKPFKDTFVGSIFTKNIAPNVSGLAEAAINLVVKRRGMLMHQL